MSVEAISWALNLAPVPADCGGKPSSACKFVLVGLANHAGPDGTGAFPAVATLVRYTGLSERTVRTALDPLAAEEIIRPCDPAVMAAKIKRADRRPQGWDLVLDRIRGDFTGQELASLECQFPGLAARVTAGRGAASAAGSGPVDNHHGEVQQLHPAIATGCSERQDGVQPVQARGAAAVPEPYIELSTEPPAARAHARTGGAAAGGPGGGGVSEFFTALGPAWPLAPGQRHRLAPAVSAAIEAGWTPSGLAAFAGANTGGVRSPYAVLSARVAPGELPAPPSRAPSRPPWCGGCDPGTRLADDPHGRPARCPRCHPLTAADTEGEPTRTPSQNASRRS